MAANSNLVAQFLRFFAFFSRLRLLLLLACPCPGGIERSRITRHIGFVYNMCHSYIFYGENGKGTSRRQQRKKGGETAN